MLPLIQSSTVRTTGVEDGRCMEASQQAGCVCVGGVTIFYHVWLCLSFLIDPHGEQKYYFLELC